jgi:hypothetical protein
MPTVSSGICSTSLGGLLERFAEAPILPFLEGEEETELFFMGDFIGLPFMGVVLLIPFLTGDGSTSF